MHQHRPNSIPRSARVLLAVATGALLFVIAAGLATGYTYVPGKRGGLLLSGIPTLVLCSCLMALCCACLLTIVDHYDQRPNEHSYRAARRACFKISLSLFVAAPIIEIVLYSFSLAGVDIPTFRGLASSETIYSPKLNSYSLYVTPLLDHGLPIGLVSASLCGLGLLIDKHGPAGQKRTVAALIGLGMLGLSSLMLASATGDLLSGAVSAGRRSYELVVRAESEPAKFNAILLTHFGVGAIMFFASAATLAFGALAGPKKREPRRRSNNSSKPKPLRGSA